MSTVNISIHTQVYFEISPSVLKLNGNKDFDMMR